MNTPTESPLVQRLRGWADAARAAEDGRKWQFCDGNEWFTPTNQSVEFLENLISNQIRLRPAPEPIIRAWTLETAPVDQAVFVKYVADGEMDEIWMIEGWRKDGVNIACHGGVSYEQLRTDYLRADGSVCGTVEDAK
jgi:hypothetical protein